MRESAAPRREIEVLVSLAGPAQPEVGVLTANLAKREVARRRPRTESATNGIELCLALDVPGPPAKDERKVKVGLWAIDRESQASIEVRIPAARPCHEVARSGIEITRFR